MLGTLKASLLVDHMTIDTSKRPMLQMSPAKLEPGTNYEVLQKYGVPNPHNMSVACTILKVNGDQYLAITETLQAATA